MIFGIYNILYRDGGEAKVGQDRMYESEHVSQKIYGFRKSVLLKLYKRINEI